jgi:hypothetical protein
MSDVDPVRLIARHPLRARLSPSQAVEEYDIKRHTGVVQERGVFRVFGRLIAAWTWRNILQ